MRESQYSLQIEARGKQKGELHARRADLLEGLTLKFGVVVPEPIRLAIEGTNDPATLGRWFRALFEVSSWSEFEPRLKQG